MHRTGLEGWEGGTGSKFIYLYKKVVYKKGIVL